MEQSFSSSPPVDPGTKRGGTSKEVLWNVGKIFLLFLLVTAAYIIGTKTAPTNTNLTISKPTFSKALNQTFTFPVRDNNGNIISHLTYIIQSADLTKQIILQGQKADAVAGRTFLIINLKIVNSSTQNMQINTRDFIRIRVDNASELQAPEIHNDPVTIQPISTKYTRIGLPVNDTIKDIKLEVGELNGQKTTVDIEVKK